MWILYASEIAACIGENRYKTPGEAAKKIFERHNEHFYNFILNQLDGADVDVDIAEIAAKFAVDMKLQEALKIKEPEERKNNIDEIAKQVVLENEAKIKETVNIISNITDESTMLRNKEVIKDLVPNVKKEMIENLVKETATLMSNATDEIEKKIITDNLVTQIQKHKVNTLDTVAKITSFVNTERGKRDEDESLNRTEIETKKKIGQRNDKFYKMKFPLLKIDIFDEDEDNGELTEKSPDEFFMIGGRIDGVNEDGILVEIKNRQNRIFSFIPSYEKVQIHVYMKLLNFKTAHLVQKITIQNKNESKTNVIEFDEKYWDDIEDACRKFVAKLESIINDHSALKKLVKNNIF